MTLEELLRQGKSFGQGASNAAASTVTGPVDMLAWLLRKGGVNVGEAPIGGEAWMRQKGLMATPENRLAGLLGEGAGLAAPIVAAAKAPEIAGGLLQMGRNLATPQTLNKQTGAIVYHGSPHKFDKFDSSKIGTGEGAQAYGHGLYLAESPDVAQGYKTTLSPYELVKDGKQIPYEQMDAVTAGVASDIASKKGDLKAVRSMYENMANQKFGGAVAKQRLAALDSMGANVGAEKGGSLYKVDLPDDQIAKMLDWDKPLSQQSKEVQAALAATKNKQLRAVVDYANSPYSTPGLEGEVKTMGEAIKLLGMNASPAKGSAMLAKQGIPGIRYLDGGSRSAGAGSSNFVVFPGNEGLLKILERNGGKP